MRYVALLRGINVGGRTLVKMADLVTCFEQLGFAAVSTYIASGNVLFETDESDPAELATTIEAAIEQRFELPVKVVVLDRAAYAAIVGSIPDSWIGDGTGAPTSRSCAAAPTRRRSSGSSSPIPRSRRSRRSREPSCGPRGATR